MTQTPSGKFVLRLPPELHRRLRRAADARDLSLNEHCVRILSGDPWQDQSQDHSLVLAIEREFGASLVGVLLFGSAARGELTDASDIDLLVIVDQPITRALYRRWDEATAIQEAMRGYSHEVNPQFVRPLSGSDAAGGIWLEASIDGRILWERDSRLSLTLARLRRAIAEGTWVRAYTHGHPYWIRKKAG